MLLPVVRAVIPIRFPALALFSLLLLSSLTFAFQFNVTVVDKDGMRLPHTQVSVLTGNTVLYQKATAENNSLDNYGRADFDLAAGTYFIRLNRSFYPEHIVMYTLTGDANLQLVMLINRQSYILYGQVIDDPPSRWEGANLSLLDSNGHVVRTTTVMADGYYIIYYLDTTMTYQLRLDAGSRLLSAPFSFNQPNAYYVPLDLRTNALVNASPSLSAPPTAPLYSPITAVLRAGTSPMPNQSMTVVTPAGTLTLVTDANGQVRVNSAAPGDYVFSWGNQTVRTTVAPLVMPQPVVPAEPAPPAPSAEAPLSATSPPVSPSAPAPAANSIPLVLGLLLVIVLVGAGVVIAMAVLGPWLHRKLIGPRYPASHEGHAASKHAPLTPPSAPPARPPPTASSAGHAKKLSGPGHQPHLKHKGRR